MLSSPRSPAPGASACMVVNETAVQPVCKSPTAAMFTVRSRTFPRIWPPRLAESSTEVVQMVGSQDAAALENGDARSRRATTGRRHRVTMPSAHHSVVAKARRYRAEPERVDIVADDPLVAIVHGLHADHTVRHTEQGLVCSCERFRRGQGVCAHVLAAEQRPSTSAANAATVADLVEAL